MLALKQGFTTPNVKLFWAGMLAQPPARCTAAALIHHPLILLLQLIVVRHTMGGSNAVTLLCTDVQTG